MATPTLDFFGILSESKKIMKSHSRHFLALSVLFLLPLSFSLSVLPTLQTSITNPPTNQAESLLRYSFNYLQEQEQQPFIDTLKPLFLYLLYAFCLISLSLCATATITYSVYHGFFGRPVKLISAIKSLSNSFPRLLITALCAQVIVLGIGIGFGLVVLGIIRGIELLGFQIVYSTTFYTVIHVIGFVGLGLGLMYLQVNWALASVVVVVESSWGLEPLRRSAYLVRGMRRVVVSLLLFFGGLSWLMVWGSWESVVGSTVLRALMFVVQTVSISAVLMVLLLHSVAANTVLYMYCKALHGELAGEIAEEFAREYVSLPFHEEKVPFVISVVQP